jgi:hypothetical protein
MNKDILANQELPDFQHLGEVYEYDLARLPGQPMDTLMRRCLPIDLGSEEWDKLVSRNERAVMFVHEMTPGFLIKTIFAYPAGEAVSTKRFVGQIMQSVDEDGVLHSDLNVPSPDFLAMISEPGGVNKRTAEINEPKFLRPAITSGQGLTVTNNKPDELQ